MNVPSTTEIPNTETRNVEAIPLIELRRRGRQRRQNQQIASQRNLIQSSNSPQIVPTIVLRARHYGGSAAPILLSRINRSTESQNSCLIL